MKKKKLLLKKAWCQFCEIKLVDRILIIIMMILMVEALIGVFTPFGDSNVTDRIDVVMRTTMASIFGYFISANFIKTEDEHPLDEEEHIVALSNNTCSELLVDEEPIKPLELQVKVIGSICIFSIIALFSIRYFAYENKESLAFIFLFRDFICGSIGYLIGMPNESNL